MRSFWTKIDALEAWHAKLVDKPWLQPLKPTKLMIVLIVLSTLIAAGMNWYVRHWQYQVWEQNTEIFYLDDGTPLFTTTDAPYFWVSPRQSKTTGVLSPFKSYDYIQLDKKTFATLPHQCRRWTRLCSLLYCHSFLRTHLKNHC